MTKKRKDKKDSESEEMPELDVGTKESIEVDEMDVEAIKRYIG